MPVPIWLQMQSPSSECNRHAREAPAVFMRNHNCCKRRSERRDTKVRRREKRKKEKRCCVLDNIPGHYTIRAQKWRSAAPPALCDHRDGDTLDKPSQHAALASPPLFFPAAAPQPPYQQESQGRQYVCAFQECPEMRIQPPIHCQYRREIPRRALRPRRVRTRQPPCNGRAHPRAQYTRGSSHLALSPHDPDQVRAQRRAAPKARHHTSAGS